MDITEPEPEVQPQLIAEGDLKQATQDDQVQEQILKMSNLAGFAEAISKGQYFRTRPDVRTIGGGTAPCCREFISWCGDRQSKLVGALALNHLFGPAKEVKLVNIQRTRGIAVRVESSIYEQKNEDTPREVWINVSRGKVQYARLDVPTGAQSKEPKHKPKFTRPSASAEGNLAHTAKQAPGQIHSSPFTVEIEDRKWTHVLHAGQAGVHYDRNKSRLGIVACFILRHYNDTNQVDGGVEWNVFGHTWSQDGALWLLRQLAEATNKARYEVSCHPVSPIARGEYPLLTSRRYKSGEIPLYDEDLLPGFIVDPLSADKIYHLGHLHNQQNILNNGLIAGGTGRFKGGQSCYFSMAHPLTKVFENHIN